MHKSIYIVEDDDSTWAIFREMIHSIDPTAAIERGVSAEQARKKIEETARSGKSFDLIIADIFLSGSETGLDLWEACWVNFPKIPVLITSGLPLSRYFEAIGNAVMAPPFLQKPINPGECRQVLEAALA